MDSDRIFVFALLFSVIAHGFILFQNPDFATRKLSASKKNRNQEQLEVQYLEGQPQPQAKAPLPAALLKQGPGLRPPPFIRQENILKKGTKLEVPRMPVNTKSDIVALKKKVTLPPLDINKISTPGYLNYYQMVREKIRRAAYQNYLASDTGEIYLEFTISNDGRLNAVNLIEKKSSPSLYLKEIALKSIRAASPFPAFPSELKNYPQLSFHLVVSFEVE